MATVEREEIGILQWNDIVFDIPRSKADQAKLQKRRDDVEKAEQHSNGSEPSTPTAPASGDDEQSLQNRRILSGVGGMIHRGQMMAILGASGAGKTTLLNILSGRLSMKGQLYGQVLFEGEPRRSRAWKKAVGFVEQDDLMLPLQTVHEVMLFSASLRLSDKVHSSEAKRARAENVLQMLGLDACRDTKIGNSASRGVSGGERKRASIGVEMVSDVPLLFMDEPTSGLDAHAANKLVSNLRSIVRSKNIACIMTIHQPSWAMIQMYDTVQLLARGRLYYSGPPGEMIAWFESIGYTPPQGCNPTDYYVSLAENPENSEEGELRVTSLLREWNSRQSIAAEMSLPETPSTSEKKAEQTAARIERGISEKESAWPTNWVSEFLLLSQRNARQLLRDTATMKALAGQTTILLILIGFAFFRLGDSQSDVLARVGILFFLSINTIFTVLLPVIGPLAMQRAIMRRERLAGMYRTSSFYLSKVLLDTTSNICFRLPFIIILYWMCGLRSEASAFFIFIGVNVVLVSVAVSMGLFVGSISPNVELANILAPLVTVVFLLFGGNLLPNPPPWFIWLRWISPITYAYMALSQNEFRGLEFRCDAGQQTQCYRTGEQVLQQYNLRTFTIAECVGFLFAIGFAFAFAGYIGLRILVHPRMRLKPQSSAARKVT